MSLILQTIIIGVVALAILPFSVEMSKGAVLIGFLGWSVLLFIKGLLDLKLIRQGKQLKDTSGVEVLPYAMPAVWIVITIFILNDLNSFHLLWVVTLTLMIVEGVVFGFNSHRKDKQLGNVLKK